MDTIGKLLKGLFYLLTHFPEHISRGPSAGHQYHYGLFGEISTIWILLIFTFITFGYSIYLVLLRPLFGFCSRIMAKSLAPTHLPQVLPAASEDRRQWRRNPQKSKDWGDSGPTMFSANTVSQAPPTEGAATNSIKVRKQGAQ